MSLAADAPTAAPRARVRHHTLVLLPPEGVPIHLTLPSLGTRLGAQVIDFLITGLLTGLLGAALIFSGAATPDAEAAILSLLLLLVGTPFYMGCELLMNGRTPGKRLTGIRVVSLDGAGLSTHQVVVRNLLKEVEIFLPLQLLPFVALGRTATSVAILAWTIVVIVVPWRSRARQRIGDIAAGTVVVAQPDARLLPDLAATPPTRALRDEQEDAGERFVFTSDQLELYGAFELQVLERLLRGRTGAAPQAAPDAAAMAQVSASIRRKINYADPVPPAEVELFLLAFYRAQRAFLEQKKLFGDARRDKFHRKRDQRPEE